MELETVYLARLRECYSMSKENNALLREALLLLRALHRPATGAAQTPSSPPSSSSPTDAPLTTPTSLLKRWANKTIEKIWREAFTSFLMWLGSKLLVWVGGYLTPFIIAWVLGVRPLLRWLGW